MKRRNENPLNAYCPTEKQHILGRHLTPLPLAQVCADTGPYAMTFDFDPSSLRESIRRIGLVNSPCIAKNHQGQIEIVTGYRRILALKQLGWNQVGCEDVTSSLPSTIERLLFAFYDNVASRSFNTIEKAMVLKHFRGLVKEEDILKTIMPYLSMSSHQETLDFYLQLAEVPKMMKESLVRDRLSIQAAKSLIKLEPETRECLFHWISNLSLNFNQQLQYIDIMTDMSIINGKPCSELMHWETLQSIIEDTSMNTPQKAKKVLDALRSLRYPKWKGAEKKFKERIELLSLPMGTRIDHPPSFEAPGYRLEIQFRDGKELVEKLRQLSSSRGLNEFQDPFSNEN